MTPPTSKPARPWPSACCTKKATRMMRRVASAYRLATARRPTSVQRQTLVGSLDKLKKAYAAAPAEAAKLLAVGALLRDAKLDPIEHAAYTALCTLILNLDESLTRQ